MRTLIVDNYDSYTYNLYQAIAQVNQELPLVIHNDQISWEELQTLDFDNIVISPGPGRPEKPSDFGICKQVIENIKVPLLGVCLGHQGIGYCYGAKIINAPEVRHGRLSKIYHNGSELFRGIPNNFKVVRYHSLLVANDLPDCLEKIAWTEDGLIMALRHQNLPLWGVQFHPESICTEYGQKLLENFRDITQQFTQKSNIQNPKNPNPVLVEQASCLSSLNFELKTRKLNIYPDSEQIFVQLFGDSPNNFWLDSSLVETNQSRFSFMGDGNGVNSLLVSYYSEKQELIVTQSETVIHQNKSIFEYLKQEINRRKCQSYDLPFDFNCGFVGYFGYELKGECGSKIVNSSTLPDGMFLFADRLIAIDHQEQTIYLLHLIKTGQQEIAETWFNQVQNQLENLTSLPPIVFLENPKPVEFRLSRSYATYIEDIHQCLEEIHQGETYQVCLTNQLYTETIPNPIKFYRILRHINPAPYSAFLRFGEIAIACSSPERFLKIDRQKWVETKPIKGTQKRGKTPEEDIILRESLRNSEKDRAENLMIVDLLRNDLGKVCEIGSVHVPKLMDVETFSTVHQLVTTVKGKLRSDLQAIDCIKASFPGGSMTGAPKIRTMEIIDRLEQEARGVYSGAIGFLALNGSADLNIVIRTAIITPEHTSIGIGGGIVALSDPEKEFQEMLLKAKALIQALELTIEHNYESVTQ
ncbi:aminodeoxychorismate synthase component I [[Phormidium ambiguum] IAM M-71]|uniref:aminodeoxychorismate synthase n=1 Tax=[Phormidium ambiguum] IAM M-71 TaxID=454136 RepID=A0A1U7I463_9CYAN|nr:aminodeoxychorismate synthase [Phormidium ambiguum]OKH31001.1 aminodeoxychorismate synthase component I [Phormidium ambiguum IAM M-71]